MLPLLASAASTARTAPELSDVFLFAAAVLAFWFVRRSLRKRFRDRGPK